MPPLRQSLRALVLVVALSVGTSPSALGQAATGPRRLENGLTTGGLNIAPRYLDHVGDVDLNLQGGAVNYPSSGGFLMGAQVGIQAKLGDRLQLLTNLGPLNEVALRGPLWSQGGTTLGWDARYRAEVFFTNVPGFGLTSTPLGLTPGAIAQGLEFKLNGMQAMGPLTLYVSPLLSAMSNRTALGAEAGLDARWRQWAVGYSLSARSNAFVPAESFGVLPSETQHGLGLRYMLDNGSYLQANYYMLPTDAYGIPTRTLLVGFGQRLFGTVPLAPIEEEPVQTAPEPVVQAVAPTPAAPAPVPPAVALRGRLYHSLLADMRPGERLTVRLKRRIPGTDTFEKIPTTAQTDPDGTFAFPELPAGDYQVYYKDEGTLPNALDFAVSEAVTVPSEQAPILEMDLAWDEAAFRQQVQDGMATVTWSPQAGPDTVYQGLLQAEFGGKTLNFRRFTELATRKRAGRIDLSDLPPDTRLLVKYWKQDGRFNGATYYGQSKPQDLRLLD